LSVRARVLACIALRSPKKHLPSASVSAKTEGKRTGEFNHFKALSEASQGLTWVAFLPGVGAPLPGAACDEAWAAAEFWVNKVLMEFRGKDDKQVAWAAALKALFTALRAYVKAHHAAGPAWNARGGDAADFKAGAAAPAGVSGGAPPPPPPPPPPGGPGSLIRDAAPAKPAGPNMNALFGEINKGENVASGLRKVTDDMKAKNRTDRSGAVPATAAPAAASAPGRGGAAPLGTPRLACEGGRKWVVEHQVDAKELRVTDVNAKQTVYVYNCRGSVVTIAGKVNSVCVDGCSRTAVVFADVVAAVEVVNCSAVELQATGVVPTVAVDNCNGVQLYLNAAAMACAITTAKSSAVNVLVPGKTADDDLVEAPIPEQFVTTFVKGKWLTEPVAHSAG
jgi:adenylyl cyclase-associated protein